MKTTEQKINYRCPKCGAEAFEVTAHVTQDWKIDSCGNFLECLNDCVEVTHSPDDDDMWTCANCGFSAEGRRFSVKGDARPYDVAVKIVTEDAGLTWASVNEIYSLLGRDTDTVPFWIKGEDIMATGFISCSGVSRLRSNGEEEHFVEYVGAKLISLSCKIFEKFEGEYNGIRFCILPEEWSI